MAPFPNGSGDGHAGHGDDRRDLTTGEIVAIVLSCVLGPGALWMLLSVAVCQCSQWLSRLAPEEERRGDSGKLHCE